MKKTQKTKETYISPFVRQAREEAKKRSKEAAKKLQRNKTPLNISSDWDGNTKGFSLFDSSIRKQEVFRLQPKIHPPKFQDQQSDVSDSTFIEDMSINSEDVDVENRSKLNEKLTVRSGKEVLSLCYG